MLAFLTSVGKVDSLDSLRALVDAGFSAVNFGLSEKLEPGENEKYADRVRRWADLHREAGLKFFLRWPQVDQFGFRNPEYALQTYDGKRNSETSDVGDIGPSYWNEEAIEKEIETLSCFAPGDVDGFILSPLLGDALFPLLAGKTTADGEAYSDLYFCHDPWAKASWKERFGDRPLPKSPRDDTSDEFMDWFQTAVLAWYDTVTEALLPITKQLLTWYLPSLKGDPVKAGPGLEPKLEAWRQQVMAQGGDNPIFIVNSMFPEPNWPVKVYKRFEAMCDPNGDYGWQVVGGVQHANTPDEAKYLIYMNGARLAGMGAAGFSTGIIAVAPVVAEVKEIMASIEKGFWWQDMAIPDEPLPPEKPPSPDDILTIVNKGDYVEHWGPYDLVPGQEMEVPRHVAEAMLTHPTFALVGK